MIINIFRLCFDKATHAILLLIKERNRIFLFSSRNGRVFLILSLKNFSYRPIEIFISGFDDLDLLYQLLLFHIYSLFLFHQTLHILFMLTYSQLG